jgi:HAD superfamily hydrolase (TIGR01509 family)
MVMKAESPGNYAITLLDWLGLDAAVVSAVSRVRAISGVRPSNEFRLIPGVQGMLRSLHARGYRLGIVTTRTRQVIVEFLECFPEIGEVIEVTCGLQDTRRLKPHPAPVRLAASRLGVRVDQCLMVGDTVPDIKSARRAGAWCVAVLCGFGERNELEKAGAHAILGSTAELDQLLADHAEGTSALRTDPPLK